MTKIYYTGCSYYEYRGTDSLAEVGPKSESMARTPKKGHFGLAYECPKYSPLFLVRARSCAAMCS